MNDKKFGKSNKMQVQKLPTGIEGFDDVCRGGLPVSRSTLVSGTSGTGKTVFSLQYLHHGICNFDEPGIFVTFEESPLDIIRNAASFGWDLQELIDQNKLFILDFQQYDAIYVVRREIFRLIARLKEIGVTTVMTTERVDDYGPIARYGVEEFVSDNVVLLRNVLESEKRRRTLEVLKLRGTVHMKGEYPFTMGMDGISVFALGAMRLTQRSSNIRISSGVKDLDDMCGGGYFQDSIILATGATGTGKTMLVSKFVEDAYNNNERAILFAYEESRAQLLRNATSWGIDFEKMESDGLLKIICAYPESTGLEDHLQIIKTQINQFKPKRMAIDSLSALARGVSLNAFRQFVIAVTGYTKQEEIAGFFTNTAEEFMGSHSITDSHISTITDTILLLQYVEIKGEMARALNVFKMRGSWHDKRIREFIITNSGPEIRDSFSNFEQIFSGAPHRVVPDQNVQNVFKGLDNN